MMRMDKINTAEISLFTNIVWIVPCIHLKWFQFITIFPVHIFIMKCKVLKQGKWIAVAYTLFVNKNRCISFILVSEEVKSIKFW